MKVACVLVRGNPNPLRFKAAKAQMQADALWLLDDTGQHVAGFRSGELVGWWWEESEVKPGQTA